MPKNKRVISSKELSELYAKGYNSRQIAEMYGVSWIWLRKLKQKLKSGEAW